MLLLLGFMRRDLLIWVGWYQIVLDLGAAFLLDVFTQILTMI